MAYIDIKDYDKAEGRLKEIYDELIEKRGMLAEVHMAQSLNPESIVKHMDLYTHIMFGQSPLKRYQRELLGSMTSIANDCEYCIAHHTTALNHFWKDDARIKQLIIDYKEADLEPADRLLAEYAVKLTQDPTGVTELTHITPLKEAGFDDRAILDATLVVSYFNFVNRMMLGLGIDLEEHKGEGFYYD